MLVTTIDHIRAVVPVNATMEMETFKPYIDAAEQQYIIPVLGNELYKELDALAEGDGNEKQKALLKLVHYAEINLAFQKGFDFMNVTLDESGYERLGKDKGIYRYQEEKLKGMFRGEGFNGIDTLLEYLQTNLTDFEKFKTSAFYAELKGSFFPTTSAFNKIYGIGNSRQVFLQIARFFDVVLDFEIKPVLGNALYSKVLAEMQKDADQNADLMALVPVIRKPLAFLSVAAGIDEVGMQVTEKGLFFEMEFPMMPNTVQTTQLTPEQMAMMHQKALQSGTRYKEMLLTYLLDNQDKYPDFTQTSIENTNPYRRDNSGKRTFFA